MSDGSREFCRKGEAGLCVGLIFFDEFFFLSDCLDHRFDRSPCVNEDDEHFQWQSWIISRGENNLIRFEGTEYCLHAGDVPANGSKVTL